MQAVAGWLAGAARVPCRSSRCLSICGRAWCALFAALPSTDHDPAQSTTKATAGHHACLSVGTGTGQWFSWLLAAGVVVSAVLVAPAFPISKLPCACPAPALQGRSPPAGCSTQGADHVCGRPGPNSTRAGEAAGSQPTAALAQHAAQPCVHWCTGLCVAWMRHSGRHLCLRHCTAS